MTTKNNRKKHNRRDIHRQILERARISANCIEIATSRLPAEARPVGRASAKLFDSIVNCRPYDSYCRPIPRINNEDEDNSRAVFQQITVRPAHRPLHEIRVEPDAKVDGIRRTQDPGLSDYLSNTGYEPTTYGPPGLRPPIKGILKSRGNEQYFQGYNGDWQDGLPDGIGTYTTASGNSYAGQLHKGQPHGHGQFSAPSNVTASSSSTNDEIYYEGEYQLGLPHGKGKYCYRRGITYDGEWKSGRRDGQGTITYPNKSQYIGGFRRGQMHGHGTFTSPTSGVTYSGKFRNGYVSGVGYLTLASGATVMKNWQSKEDPKPRQGSRRNERRTVIEAIEHMMTLRDSG